MDRETAETRLNRAIYGRPLVVCLECGKEAYPAHPIVWYTSNAPVDICPRCGFDMYLWDNLCSDSTVSERNYLWKMAMFQVRNGRWLHAAFLARAAERYGRDGFTKDQKAVLVAAKSPTWTPADARRYWRAVS